MIALIVILIIFAVILYQPIRDIIWERMQPPEERYRLYCQACYCNHRIPCDYIEWCKLNHIK
jgi:hypothetical protein